MKVYKVRFEFAFGEGIYLVMVSFFIHHLSLPFRFVGTRAEVVGFS